MGKKKKVITGKLVINGVMDKNSNVYDLEGIEFPSLVEIKTPFGDPVYGKVTHCPDKSLNLEVCTNCFSDEYTEELVKEVLDVKLPEGADRMCFTPGVVGMSSRGMITEMSYTIEKPFWNKVFRFKLARILLWFVYKRVKRVQVVTGFTPLSFDIVKK